MEKQAMQLTREQKSTIERVVNAFETGSADGDYGAVSIYADGPNRVRQITYGRSQTTEYGNLRTLIRKYVDAKALYSGALEPYADHIGSAPLTDDPHFKKLLRHAGRQDTVMRTVQDEFFDKAYFQPAIQWADAHGFTLPLSALVIYDSFIHSGSILWVIRQRFAENPPALGGDEAAWITAYLRERRIWLGLSPRPAVRKSVYRVKDLTREADANNWDLSQLPVLANGVPVHPAG
jgi:chitosanase